MILSYAYGGEPKSGEGNYVASCEQDKLRFQYVKSLLNTYIMAVHVRPFLSDRHVKVSVGELDWFLAFRLALFLSSFWHNYHGFINYRVRAIQSKMLAFFPKMSYLVEKGM